MISSLKPVEWVGSSLEDVREFPKEVQQVVGYALYIAQCGEKHPSAKPLKGFKGAGVLEVVEDFDGDTYRAVYTVRTYAKLLSVGCVSANVTHHSTIFSVSA